MPPTTASRDGNFNGKTTDPLKLSKFRNIHRKMPEMNMESHHPTNIHRSFRPSHSMPHELWQDAVGSDRDVWVERSCLGRIVHNKKSSSKQIQRKQRQQQQKQQRRIVYYYSLQTGQCKLLEPPTGASCILLESEHVHLSQQVQEWLANETKLAPDSLSGVKPPKQSLDVEKKRKKSLFFRWRK